MLSAAKVLPERAAKGLRGHSPGFHHSRLYSSAVFQPPACVSATVCPVQAKLSYRVPGAPEMTMAAINTALLGYTGALTASLQLLGPAVLHAYKHAGDRDEQLSPGTRGCPVSRDGTPTLEGTSVGDAALNLFGSGILRLAGTSGEDSTAVAAARCTPH